MLISRLYQESKYNFASSIVSKIWIQFKCIKNLNTDSMYSKSKYTLDVFKIWIQSRFYKCIQNLDTIYKCIKNLDTIWIALATSEHMFTSVRMFTRGGGGQLCVCR